MSGPYKNQTIERADAPAINDEIPLRTGDEFLSKGVLLRQRSRIVRAAVLVLLAASLLSYFVKPRAPFSELVSPEQELPGFAAQYPGSNSLSQRVLSSYGLAFVLFETPYSGENVRALENVRSWGRHKFQAAPDFLHPVSIRPEQEPNDTVIGAVGYNLFAELRYTAQSVVGEFLKNRIEDFHHSQAYESFNEAYFQVFGKDGEAATLLAKYQSDKAKQAIDSILWSIVWGMAMVLCAGYLLTSPRSQRFDRIRHSLIGVWGIAALSYGITAWMNNSIPAFSSAIMCCALSLYFTKPFMLLTREDASLKVIFINLSSRWIALSVWASYSALAILVLTWIRSSLPDSSDPVTMLLSACSGNFLYDPDEGKRIIARAIGIVWICVSLWALTQKDKDAKLSDQLEAELRELDRRQV